MSRIKFSEHEATAHKGIVVSLDLSGFSEYCNQPDASTAAPRLIKYFFDVLNEALGDQGDWTLIPSGDKNKLVEPNFIKFTGDGALMLWLLPKKEDFSQEFCNLVVQTMRNFQHRLSVELPTCEKKWRVHNLPKRVRVGIATGIIYALRPPHSFTSLTEPNDFVGYCINLAVRLQNHCPKIGFLVQGDLHPELPGMEFYKAIGLHGSQQEPVALFREDTLRVSQTELKLHFKALDML